MADDLRSLKRHWLELKLSPASVSFYAASDPGQTPWQVYQEVAEAAQSSSGPGPSWQALVPRRYRSGGPEDLNG